MDGVAASRDGSPEGDSRRRVPIARRPMFLSEIIRTICRRACAIPRTPFPQATLRGRQLVGDDLAKSGLTKSVKAALEEGINRALLAEFFPPNRLFVVSPLLTPLK